MSEICDGSLKVLYLGILITLTVIFGIVLISPLAIQDSIAGDILITIAAFVSVCAISIFILKWCVLSTLKYYERTQVKQEIFENFSESFTENAEILEDEKEQLRKSCNNLENQLANLSLLGSHAQIALRKRASLSARSLSAISLGHVMKSSDTRTPTALDHVMKSSDTHTPTALDISPIQRPSPAEEDNDICEDTDFCEVPSFSELQSENSIYFNTCEFSTQNTSSCNQDNRSLFENKIKTYSLPDITDISSTEVGSTMCDTAENVEFVKTCERDAMGSAE